MGVVVGLKTCKSSTLWESIFPVLPKSHLQFILCIYSPLSCFGDIRYNGSLDTCRGMASGLLSHNGFSCLFNCVESTILLKCRSKHFVSTTRRFARYEQCGVSYVWMYFRHLIDRRNIFFDHQSYGSARLF